MVFLIGWENISCVRVFILCFPAHNPLHSVRDHSQYPPPSGNRFIDGTAKGRVPWSTTLTEQNESETKCLSFELCLHPALPTILVLSSACFLVPEITFSTAEHSQVQQFWEESVSSFDLFKLFRFIWSWFITNRIPLSLFLTFHLLPPIYMSICSFILEGCTCTYMFVQKQHGCS